MVDSLDDTSFLARSRQRQPWLNQWMILVCSLLVETPPPSIAPSLLPASIAAVVAVVVFWLGYWLNRRAARQERQRQVIADWLRTLSGWVDKFGHPNSTPDYNYHALTNRGVVELSLKRRNRYLAWWMHEMAVAVILRRLDATSSWQSRSTCNIDIEAIITATTEPLLAWHHGKLKSTDFHIPYQLRHESRKTNEEVHALAKRLNLGEFVTPTRMNLKRSWQFQRLLLDPKTGTPVLDVLQQFIGRRYGLIAYLNSRLRILGFIPRMSYQKILLARAQRKLAHSERRLHEAEAALEDLKSMP